MSCDCILNQNSLGGLSDLGESNSLEGVSVIIATLNPGISLHTCLESILKQKAVEVEILVFDGGSNDGTVQYLQHISGNLKTWRSEPDKGIYDAWNKALPFCEKEWVVFLGADDSFATPDALARVVFEGRRARSMLVFSKISRVSASGEWLDDVGEPWNWRQHRIWQKVAHPGALHHRALFEKYGIFDSSLKIVGDYEFLLRLESNTPVAFLDTVTVLAGEGGVSRRDVTKVFKEARTVQAAHPDIGPLVSAAIYYLKLFKMYLRSAGLFIYRWRRHDF